MQSIHSPDSILVAEKHTIYAYANRSVLDRRITILTQSSRKPPLNMSRLRLLIHRDSSFFHFRMQNHYLSASAISLISQVPLA